MLKLNQMKDPNIIIVHVFDQQNDGIHSIAIQNQNKMFSSVPFWNIWSGSWWK